MKSKSELQVNVSITEAICRMMLIIPAGMFGVYAFVALHTYLFVFLPIYLLVTALTYYSPVKHLYTAITHRPLFVADHELISA